MDWGALAGPPRDVRAVSNRFRARRVGKLRRRLDAEAHKAWTKAILAELPKEVLERYGRLV